MNIREFSNAVGLISLNYPTVQEYNEGDIYNYLNTGEHKYPCIFLTIESVEEGELNSQTLTGSLFYVDRLLNDSSNRLMVQTAAISTLKILTGKIADNISGEMVVVSYQPFTEKFADWCAGAFCEFSFTYITGSECGEYDELALNVRKNGVYDVLGYEKIVVSVPSGGSGVTEEWVENYSYSKQEVDSKLSQKADKTEIPSLTGYATETWVDGKLTSYAKKTDIPSLTGYATETWVDGKLTSYAKKTDIPSLTGYATELWVQNQGYLTEHQPLKTINGQSIVGEGNIEIEGGSGVTIEQVDAEIDSKLTGYATKEELNSKADIIYVDDQLSRKAELSYVNAKLSGKVDRSSIWTGTEAEWNALTQEQKASYTIALVR